MRQATVQARMVLGSQSRLRLLPLLAAVAGAAGIMLAGVLVGAASLSPGAVFAELADRLPFVAVESGLDERSTAILWQLRVPRVVLGLLVGGMLAMAGGAYQGVFRNPLADPYLLGVAAGAGLGATAVIVTGAGAAGLLLPGAAFVGGLVAVVVTYGLGGAVGRRSSTSLILAGVAVASFFTAVQTFVQQLSSDTVREVFAWILGRLSTVGWGEVRIALPFVVISSFVLLLYRRQLDVMAVGEEEAAALGVATGNVRIVVLLAATLGTAAVVAVSGLIAFVGIIVPHAVRLVVGSSHRRVLPLSFVVGGAFLVLADVVARTVVSPSELPIGVITAFVGAPFFGLLLRRSRGGGL